MPVQNLIDQFKNTRKCSEELCRPLEIEDYVAQPIEDVSPPKWHLGHTTWFFETFILARYKKGYKVFNDDFAFIFNSYYESVGKRILRASRGNLTRPTVNEVVRYRNHVDEELINYLETCNNLEVFTLLELGIHHEQQHQELFVTDIKYVFGTNPLFPVYKSNETIKSTSAPNLGFVKIKGGNLKIGYGGKDFCYDNETPQHKLYIDDFLIADRLVTNGEYLEFMVGGGYAQFDLWLSEGWQWVNNNKINAPLYWYFHENTWYYYTLSGLQVIDLDAPVTHISFFEADAFANWKGVRLPTEAEWEVASNFLVKKTDGYNFLDSSIFMPVSSNHSQILGDAWEWTNSAYLPYPGYKKPKGAIGEYNGKFMINQMVLRGGSCATPSNHIRNTYRNFFQTDKRWQFTGIRLAKNI